MIRILFLILCIAFLSACTTTYVGQEPWVKQRVSTVVITPFTHSATVPAPLVSGIQQEVEKRLYNESGYAKGDDLKILFKVLEEDDPHGFWAAWWDGSIADSGKETLNVAVSFSNYSDTQLAEIEIEVEVGAGNFQTAPSDAVDSIANQIAEFTRKWFPNS